MYTKYKIVSFCPYRFVRTILSNTILSVYHFVHTILSDTILSGKGLRTCTSVPISKFMRRPIQCLVFIRLGKVSFQNGSLYIIVLSELSCIFFIRALMACSGYNHLIDHQFLIAGGIIPYICFCSYNSSFTF